MHYQGSLFCLLEGQDELKTHAQLFPKSKNRFEIFFTQTKNDGAKICQLLLASLFQWK